MSDIPERQPPSPAVPAGSVTVTFEYTFALFVEGQRLHRTLVSRRGQALYIAWFRVVPVLGAALLVWAGWLFHTHNDVGYLLLFQGLFLLLLFAFRVWKYRWTMRRLYRSLFTYGSRTPEGVPLHTVRVEVSPEQLTLVRGEYGFETKAPWKSMYGYVQDPGVLIMFYINEITSTPFPLQGLTAGQIQTVETIIRTHSRDITKLGKHAPGPATPNPYAPVAPSPAAPPPPPAL